MKYLLPILLFFTRTAQAQIVITADIGVTINANTSAEVFSSHTYLANTLYIAVAFSRDADAAELPTVTGTVDVNFTQIATITYNTVATGFSRLTLFRYMGTVDKTEVVTTTWSETQTAGGTTLLKVTGCDLSGTNGSGAIIQAVTNNSDATANPNVTMAALTGVRNSVISVFTNDAAAFGGTPESGWTQLTTGDFSNNNVYVMTRNTTTDNTPTVTAASSDWAGIAIEIKSAARRRIIID